MVIIYNQLEFAVHEGIHQDLCRQNSPQNNSRPTEIATKAAKCYVMYKKSICAVSLQDENYDVIYCPLAGPGRFPQAWYGHPGTLVANGDFGTQTIYLPHTREAGSKALNVFLPTNGCPHNSWFRSIATGWNEEGALLGGEGTLLGDRAHNGC